MCGQTFRAAGGVCKGKVQPWSNHTRVHDEMIMHARTHGAVGYTPYRNLDEMRLHWVRSPCEASGVIVDGYRKTPTFCTGCAKWRPKHQFRCGASTCKTCFKIVCAVCGKSHNETEYETTDVYHFLKRRTNIRCMTCRQKGMKMAGAKHKTHKGEHRRKCRCTKCGLYQAVTAFRRTRERQRTDVCGNCELVPCASCAAMLSRRDFKMWDVRKYFEAGGAKRMTCSACKKRRKHARQQRTAQGTHEEEEEQTTGLRVQVSEAHTRTCVLEPFPQWDIRRYFGVAGMKNGCVRAA